LRKHKADAVLFRQGDVPDEIVCVASGKLTLQDINHFIGEIGLFSPEKVRTMTVVCETDCERYQRPTRRSTACTTRTRSWASACG
jgi:CRP-like cAMP-binding protein